MATDDQSKTEQPTPFRLQEAREKGQVPRSTDMSGVIVLIVFSVALAAASYNVAAALARSMSRTLLMAGNAPAPSVSLFYWLQRTFHPAWQAILPIVMAMLVAAVVGNLMQTGPVFSTDPLKPDFSRLNPAQGAKRLFSLRLLWELFKLTLKLGVLGGLAWVLAGNIGQKVQAAAFAAPSSVGMLLRSTYIQVTTWMLCLLGLIALLDLLFTRRDYIRKLRMSRSDIKDEHKRREGDPDIRQKRRRLMAELLKHSRSVRRVSEADVLLTNPTHLAIALKYRPKTMRSPVVLSKGSDAVAARMRMLAAQSGVPCLRSPELARALYRECKIDRAVPAHLYKPLAPIYRWLMKRPGNRIFS
ncbi:EscU/YscU/HrcU family type III secretion system export apparatus switch protein [Dyella caseinilytica]|uniref:EscU/YscU/HrcU family type III secretion system export apparatus switch protein n=1 Tax=Dyella caseinilytica TaxID=1849581 RepID=A0ABX7GNW0_9GAMM|nr:EscU/YscU/HrcU family type III secretion system export apparatus switch protein [Dyella caseinilytica]QRN52073.1 EscU/YscU/HrcU family type III secretion system export apparatus switch protein [Dyella caseinilytica]GGA15654.1 flagellar biosynthesis protein FlhB [Dyella caseinilytica]